MLTQGSAISEQGSGNSITACGLLVDGWTGNASTYEGRSLDPAFNVAVNNILDLENNDPQASAWQSNAPWFGG